MFLFCWLFVAVRLICVLNSYVLMLFVLFVFVLLLISFNLAG